MLIGDIGGTNSRLNLYNIERLTHTYELVSSEHFSTNSFLSLESMIKEFLKKHSKEKDSYLYGCIAMAGIIVNG